MTTGTWSSLWLFVLLLAAAASLASYLLSRVGALRGMRPAGRLVIAGATVMFLAAVTIAVLSSSRWASLVSWNANAPEDEELAVPGRVLAIPDVISEEIPQPNASDPVQATHRAVSSRTRGPSSTATDAGDLSTAEAQEQSTASSAKGFMPVGYASRAQFSRSPDTYRADDCVRLFHRNPDNMRRWTIENECGSPVAIAVSSCSESGSECTAVTMALPAKLQRPVFDSDETVYGASIRLRSCFISFSSQAGALIGEPVEVRSTEEWREQWAAVRFSDPCLATMPR